MVLMGVCSLLFVVVGVYSWLLLKRNVAIAKQSMKQLKSQRCSCLRARALHHEQPLTSPHQAAATRFGKSRDIGC